MNLNQMFLMFTERGIRLKLSPRQEEIVCLVKENAPITSEALAEKIGVTRAALRADLAVLTMIGALDARPKVGYVYTGKPIVYLFLKDVGTLFIENNGVLTGAVSRKDFLKISIGGTDIHKVPIGVIMTRMPNIICADKNDNA